ncbi:hypothetical protein E2C01_013994 [Portunus trituberculatus]|uniref:Uncharacterized protein n=1 Tax=Portunus trituberculatus TaxID=210409 RepID=A0A5B7DHN6_PORTR|nr:hypothetical protein [Portunus trituberculatus]
MVTEKIRKSPHSTGFQLGHKTKEVKQPYFEVSTQPKEHKPQCSILTNEKASPCSIREEMFMLLTSIGDALKLKCRQFPRFNA